jgi:hypothetical protein
MKREKAGSKEARFPSDPHRNVFYYYTGKQGRGEEPLHDRQLENNATKSLINVLEWSNSETALRHFLTFLQQECTPPHSVQLWKPNVTYHFSLLRTPITAREALKRVLVCITCASQEMGTPVRRQPGGMPDAWIYSGNDLAIMIESKLTPSIDERQLEGHLDGVGWADFVRIDITWQEIHQCIKKFAHTLPDGKDRFLMLQFLDYLEVRGMADFEGFRSADFDAFAIYEDYLDYGRVVKDRLLKFSQLVHRRLPRRIRVDYPEVYSGYLSSGEAWVGLRKQQDPRDPLRHCNFTLELCSSCLRFTATVRDGQSTDSHKPMGLLYDRLQDPTGYRRFKKILNELGKGYELSIFRRTDRKGRDRPMPGADEWHKQASFSLGSIDIDDDVLGCIRHLLQVIPYPGMQVLTETSRGEEILLERDALIEDGAAKIERMYPVLRFIEE